MKENVKENIKNIDKNVSFFRNIVEITLYSIFYFFLFSSVAGGLIYLLVLFLTSK